MGQVFLLRNHIARPGLPPLRLIPSPHWAIPSPLNCGPEQEQAKQLFVHAFCAFNQRVSSQRKHRSKNDKIPLLGAAIEIVDKERGIYSAGSRKTTHAREIQALFATVARQSLPLQASRPHRRFVSCSMRLKVS